MFHDPKLDEKKKSDWSNKCYEILKKQLKTPKPAWYKFAMAATFGKSLQVIVQIKK